MMRIGILEGPVSGPENSVVVCPPSFTDGIGAWAIHLSFFEEDGKVKTISGRVYRYRAAFSDIRMFRVGPSSCWHSEWVQYVKREGVGAEDFGRIGGDAR